MSDIYCSGCNFYREEQFQKDCANCKNLSQKFQNVPTEELQKLKKENKRLLLEMLSLTRRSPFR